MGHEFPLKHKSSLLAFLSVACISLVDARGRLDRLFFREENLVISTIP